MTVSLESVLLALNRLGAGNRLTVQGMSSLHSPWPEFCRRLSEAGVSPDEYLYYAVYYARGGYSPGILTRYNELLCLRLWEDFCEYLKERAKNTRVLVRSQRETFHTKLPYYSSPADLLMNATVDLSAVVRMDFSFRYAEDGWDMSEVQKTFLLDTLIQLRGNPDYLSVCLYVARQYNPQQGVLLNDRGFPLGSGA